MVVAGVPPRVGWLCPRCVRPECPPGDVAGVLLNRKFRGDWAGHVRPVCPSSGLHGEWDPEQEVQGGLGWVCEAFVPLQRSFSE